MIPPGHVAQTGRGEVVVWVVVGEVLVGGAGGLKRVTRVQSTENTPEDAARKVTIFVGAQVKPRVKAVGWSQSVVMVVLGVLKAIVVSGGQFTVMGLTVDGNERVVTVGPLADTVVEY